MAESAALGAILCLSGATCRIFKDKAIQKLYRDLLKESIKVARADGALIPVDFEQKMLNKIKEYPPNKGSSMLTDRLLGKPIELGAKNGIIAKLGKIYKIPTPINDLVCTLLRHTNQL